jgi:hypothetical protein
VDPVTLRRLLVFGVCAVGVGCLYLTPDVARAPHQEAAPRPQGKPSASPSSATTADTARTTRSARPVSATTAPTGATTTAPPPDVTEDAARSTPPRRPSDRGATAFDPAGGDDEQPPAPVTDVSSAAVTPDKLTLRWPAAEDNVGVTGYRVLLNGYQVAATPLTHATVRWFNDDARDQVVQVRALDAAGNESPASPPLLVARPTPAPTPTDLPGPSAEPDPTTTPQPTPHPSQEPGDLGAGISEPQQGPEPSVNQNDPLDPSTPDRGEG